MSLQLKQLDLSIASFSNGAYFDIDRIKNSGIVKVGTRYGTGSAIDGELNMPTGLWIGEINGNLQLWVVESTNKRLQKFSIDRNTGKATFISKLLLTSYANSLVVDTANSVYWLSMYGGTSSPASYNLVECRNIVDDSLVISFYTGNGNYPSPLIDVSGDYVYILDNNDNGYIYKYDKNGNLIDTIIPDYTPIGGWKSTPTTFYFDGVYFYISNSTGSLGFKLCKVDLSGNVSNLGILYDRLRYNNHFYIYSHQSMCVDKTTGLVYIRSLIANTIDEFNESSAEWRTIANAHKKDGGMYNTGYDIWGSYRKGAISFTNGYLLVAYSDGYVVGFQRTNQIALWTNQNLGSTGVINQINVKDNNLGTRNWYIKKSSDSNWTEFEPNKYYPSGILTGVTNFDLKVEMGNFYDPIKDQIEIEEVSVLYDDGATMRPRVIPLF